MSSLFKGSRGHYQSFDLRPLQSRNLARKARLPFVCGLQKPSQQANKQRPRHNIPAAINVRDTAVHERSPVPLPVSSRSAEELQSVVVRLEQSLSSHSATSPAESSSKRESHDTVDEMKSTLSHRVITGGSLALIASLLAKGVLEIDGPVDVAASTISSLFAYYLSDFLTGVYHWGVDNYGDGSTPVVGGQIAAFQGHHQQPWTITQREFCNNLHKVFLPVAPFTAACLLISPWTPSWLDVGLATATFLTAMSQQFHAWAHMKPSDLPASVKALQSAGVLVSRKAHGAHHKAPFEGNYCIVSGFWNPILDKDGSDASFFRSLERKVKKWTGVEPRCWYEPDYSWQEE